MDLKINPAEAQRAATVLENFGLVAPGVVQYTTDLAASLRAEAQAGRRKLI